MVKNEKGSDFSEDFVLVVGSIQLFNQIIEDCYGLIACAS